MEVSERRELTSLHVALPTHRQGSIDWHVANIQQECFSTGK